MILTLHVTQRRVFFARRKWSKWLTRFFLIKTLKLIIQLKNQITMITHTNETQIQENRMLQLEYLRHA